MIENLQQFIQGASMQHVAMFVGSLFFTAAFKVLGR
jgi:hypothetical protein